MADATPSAPPQKCFYVFISFFPWLHVHKGIVSGTLARGMSDMALVWPNRWWISPTSQKAQISRTRQRGRDPLFSAASAGLESLVSIAPPICSSRPRNNIGLLSHTFYWPRQAPAWYIHRGVHTNCPLDECPSHLRDAVYIRAFKNACLILCILRALSMIQLSRRSPLFAALKCTWSTRNQCHKCNEISTIYDAPPQGLGSKG